MSAGKHLVIMAAGTGGHVMPGLAVAREMQQRGWAVSWLGTKTGMENRLVPPSGIPMDSIGFSGLRGKGLKAQMLAPVRIFNAWRQARAIMKRHGATLLLVCPDMAESTNYRAKAPGGFYARLARGERFDWLVPVPIRKGSPFRAFRVE